MLDQTKHRVVHQSDTETLQAKNATSRGVGESLEVDGTRRRNTLDTDDGGIVVRGLLARLMNPGIEEAKLVSIFSILLTFLTCILGIALSYASDSAATLSYGLQSLVDAFSSCLVLWRFWGHHGDEERLAMREKRASTMVAMGLFITALVVFETAVSNLVQHEVVTDVGMLLGLTIPSVVLLTVLGGFKWHIAQRLGSSAMKKDAVCSFASAVLSLGIIISIAVHAADPDTWWIDAALAVAVSLALAAYAGPSLVRNKWWTGGFWHAPAKDCQLDDDITATATAGFTV